MRTCFKINNTKAINKNYCNGKLKTFILFTGKRKRVFQWKDKNNYWMHFFWRVLTFIIIFIAHLFNYSKFIFANENLNKYSHVLRNTQQKKYTCIPTKPQADVIHHHHHISQSIRQPFPNFLFSVFLYVFLVFLFFISHVNIAKALYLHEYYIQSPQVKSAYSPDSLCKI